jgi:signal transduction histidine kinase
MPDGGNLTVTAAAIPTGRTLEITISDTGIGIAPERLEHIFEMRSSTKRGGLGIGMSLVKRIVERHAGSITLESTVGEGTIVRLSLPMENGV